MCCKKRKERSHLTSKHLVLSYFLRRRFAFRVSLWSQVRSSPLTVDKAVFVLDRHDRIIYAEYVAKPIGEPDYIAAL
jgi:peroxiredoxin